MQKGKPPSEEHQKLAAAQRERLAGGYFDPGENPQANFVGDRWEYWDRQVKPIDFALYTVLHADKDYMVIKQEDARFGQWVSTVWLGMDHSYGSGPPIIFETMIFGGPNHDYQERCCTEEQAYEMHARAMKQARSIRVFLREAFRLLKSFADAQYPEEAIVQFRRSWLNEIDLSPWRFRKLQRQMREWTAAVREEDSKSGQTTVD